MSFDGHPIEIAWTVSTDTPDPDGHVGPSQVTYYTWDVVDDGGQGDITIFSGDTPAASQRLLLDAERRVIAVLDDFDLDGAWDAQLWYTYQHDQLIRYEQDFDGDDVADEWCDYSWQGQELVAWACQGADTQQTGTTTLDASGRPDTTTIENHSDLIPDETQSWSWSCP